MLVGWAFELGSPVMPWGEWGEHLCCFVSLCCLGWGGVCESGLQGVDFFCDLQMLP